MTFERESRYWVYKLSDIRELSIESKNALLRISAEIAQIRNAKNKQEIECVVVEHDWLCYDYVWGLVEEESSK